MDIHTLSGINRLPEEVKTSIYRDLVPLELMERFHLNPCLKDAQQRDLLQLNCPAGASTVEMALYHQHGFPDPVLYGHITDTLNGLIHVLLYLLNDPTSPRFNVDRMPDGTPTQYGTFCRNLEAETAALEYGLAPGQVRRGLGLLGGAIRDFEAFVERLGHELFFVEPLYYHNAVIFESYGFAYEKGRSLMERIQAGLSPGGNLLEKLDSSTPFRTPEAARSIRLRSWALHDGLLGTPFTGVTMYKRVGYLSGIQTCPNCHW